MSITTESRIEPQTRPCGDCGVDVTRNLPVGTGAIARYAASIAFYCDGCSAIREAAAEAERVEEVRRDRQNRMELRVRYSGIPERHQIKLNTLDHPTHVLRAAKSWVSDGGGLMLTGDIGRGKTTIAGAAAYERMSLSDVIWTSAPLLFARLGSGLGSDQRDVALEVLRGRRALVLDDIDKARPTEYGAEQVFLAVDQRVEHEAPLLVTTNMTPGELAEKWPEPYGPAIASRLVGYCNVVRVEGSDRRLTSNNIKESKSA